MTIPNIIPEFDCANIDPQRLLAALSNVGAIHLRGALDTELVAKVRDEGEAFFALPEEKKLRNLRQYGGGYTPPGIERVIGYAPDFDRQIFDIDWRNKHLAHDPSSLFADFRSASALYDRCADIATTLIAAADAALGWNGWLRDATRGGSHGLRILHYGASDLESRFPPHLDFGMMSFFVGTDAEGLGMNICDEWRDIVIPTGDIVMIAGSLLRRECGKRVLAMRHRVGLCRRARTSIVFFAEPRAEVVLSDGLTAGEYFDARVKKVRADKLS